MSLIKLPSSTLIERVAENLGEDIAWLQKGIAFVAERVSEDTRVLAKKARYSLRNGAETIADIQDKIAADVRKRPLTYTLIAAGVAAAIGLKLALNVRKND